LGIGHRPLKIKKEKHLQHGKNNIILKNSSNVPRKTPLGSSVDTFLDQFVGDKLHSYSYIASFLGLAL
jgi:hypothetical protein